MRASIFRTALVAVAMPVTFVAVWFAAQWAWWIFAAFADAWISFWCKFGLFCPSNYDPSHIGFLDQLIHDLIPVVVAMCCATWITKYFFAAGKTDYLIGSAIILAGLAFGATSITWSVMNRNPELSWGSAIHIWVTFGVTAGMTRYFYRRIVADNCKRGT